MSELLLYSVGGTKKGPADFFCLSPRHPPFTTASLTVKRYAVISLLQAEHCVGVLEKKTFVTIRAVIIIVKQLICTKCCKNI